MVNKNGQGIHAFWIRKPGRSSLIGLLFIIFLFIYSTYLGIAWNFIPEIKKHHGYISSPNWGFLYILALPLMIFLGAFFLRLLNEAIFSLDEILISQKNEKSQFSTEMFNVMQKVFYKKIVPISFVLSTVLVLWADGYDILSPSGLTKSVGINDWTTYGYIFYSDINYLHFLIFNLLAFFSEGVLAYIGIIILLSASYPLIFFTKHNIFSEDEDKTELSFLSKYKIYWKYNDAHGRCGLHDLDKVFITYVSIIGVAVVITLISVLKNKAAGGIDTGSILLIISIGLLYPASFFWIIFPYWINFPEQLPPKDKLPLALKNEILPEPKPWPLGSEKIGWGLLFFTTIGWGSLVITGFNYILKI